MMGIPADVVCCSLSGIPDTYHWCRHTRNETVLLESNKGVYTSKLEVYWEILYFALKAIAWLKMITAHLAKKSYNLWFLSSLPSKFAWFCAIYVHLGRSGHGVEYAQHMVNFFQKKSVRNPWPTDLCVSECLHPAVGLGRCLGPESVDSVEETDLETALGLGPSSAGVRRFQLHYLLQVNLR